MPSKLLPAITAIAILLGSGFVHGLWSFRWSAARELQTAKHNLEAVPKQFGDWTSSKDQKLDERQSTVGRIDASMSRIYTNAKTGQVISALIVAGRPGPISAHTPEVCYAGSGFDPAGESTKASIDYGGPNPGEFWTLKVSKPDPARPEHLKIYYGWFAGGRWQAPSGESRFRFASYPVLYKLYVVREHSRIEGTDFDASVDFLKSFLPEVQQILNPPA